MNKKMYIRGVAVTGVILGIILLWQMHNVSVYYAYSPSDTHIEHTITMGEYRGNRTVNMQFAEARQVFLDFAVETGHMEVMLYDSGGQLVFTQSVTPTAPVEKTIEVDLTADVYRFKMSSRKGVKGISLRLALE